MAKEKVSGIYCIENIINGKKYIGLSIDIYGRWIDHKNKLLNNNHRNPKLQNSFNKHGIENFKFYILEKCSTEIISDREIYYINKFDTFKSENGYNLTSGGEVSFKMDESIYLNKALEYTERIIQFDINMEPLCCHININRANILYTNEIESLSGINQCISGKIKTIYGYIWMTQSQCEENKIDIKRVLNIEPDILKFPRLYHPRGGIVKIDKHSNVVGIFETINESNISIGNKDKGNIKSCCDKTYGRRSCHGYYWMYKDDYEKNGFDIKNYKITKSVKKVGRYDTVTMELLEIYESAREASKQGYNYKNISQVCNGEKATHKGFVWKFI